LSLVIRKGHRTLDVSEHDAEENILVPYIYI